MNLTGSGGRPRLALRSWFLAVACIVKESAATVQRGVAKLGPNRIGDFIYSRHDISCAMERGDSTECPGYVAKDAARIGINIVWYSLLQ